MKKDLISPTGTSRVNIFWFRRDLRLHDNAGLYYALKEKIPVLPIFIFDKNILDELDDNNDRRLEFINQALEGIQSSLNQIGSTLDVRYGFPVEVFKNLLDEYSIQKVFTNRDYEPYARERDAAIEELLKSSAPACMRRHMQPVDYGQCQRLRSLGRRPSPQPLFFPNSPTFAT